MEKVLLLTLSVIGVALVLQGLFGRRDDTITMPPMVGANPSDAVEAHILAGRKIEAIKVLRAETGLGLKEAKHEVERRERDLRPS